MHTMFVLRIRGEKILHRRTRCARQRPTQEIVDALDGAQGIALDRLEVDVEKLRRRRAIAHGEGRGLAMRHLRGRQVERADFDRFDFVFAMDEDNLANLARLRPAGSRARLGLLLDLAPHAGAREVPDPYYGGAEGFERVLDLVDAACAAFVATLGRG